jgi:hypothetical protein
VTSITTVIAGWSLRLISPRALMVISGLLTAGPGIMWLLLFVSGRLHLPASKGGAPATEEKDEAMLASAG